MALGNEASLVFSILAKDNASATIKQVAREVESAASSVKSKGTDAFNQFTQSLGLSEDKTKELSAALPGLGTAITTISSAAITGGAALFALAKSTADYGSQIHDIAEATNFSTETISALKLAAEQSGTSIEAVSGGLGKFSKLMGQANDGNKAAIATLKEYGLTAKTALADPEAALGKVVARIHELKGSQDQVILTQRTFGKGSQDLIPVINTVNGNLAEYIENGKKLGLVLSQEDANAADAFGDSLGELQQAVRGVSQVFAREFLPDITKAMGGVEKLLLDNKEKFKEWGQYVGDVIKGVSTPSNLPQPPQKNGKWLTWDEYTSGLGEGFGDIGNFLMQNSSNTNLARTLSGQNAAERGAKLRQQEDRQNQGILEGEYRDPNYGQTPDSTSGNKTAPGISALPERVKKVKDETKSWNVNSVLDAMRIGTMSQESSGSAGVQNPRTNATGLFQVIPDNIKKWTKETFGSEMSIDNFKKSTDAQVAVFNKYMGDYLQKGFKQSGGNWSEAIRRAAAAWYGGEGNMKNFDANFGGKGKEPTFAEYTKSVLGKTTNVLKGKGNLKWNEDLINEAKKVNEETVRNQEEADNRVLELDRVNGEKRKAELDKQLAEKKISEQEYADQIAQIGIDQLEKEKHLLEERLKLTQLSADQRADIQQKISVLAADIETKNTEKATEKIKDQNKEFERQYQINLEIAELRKQVTDAQQQTTDYEKDQERIRLQNDVDNSYGKDRLNALVVLKEFEVEEADRKHQRNLENIDAEEKRETEAIEKRAKDDVKFTEDAEKEKAAIRDKYASNRQQENDQNDATHKGIDKQYNPQINDEQTKSGSGVAGHAADILGNIAGGVSATDSEGKIKSQADLMKGVYADLAQSSDAAIGSMVSGLGDLVQQWIVTGKFSVRAAAQMVAGILASLAIEDGIKALHEYAEGVAMASNPITAPFAAGHFAAAVAYGTVAAEAGAGAAAVGLLSRAGGGGSSFQSFSNASSPNSSTNSLSSNTTDTATKTESRKQSEEADRKRTIEILVKNTHEMKPNGQWVTNSLLNDIGNMGDGREAIVRLINENS